MKSFLKYCILFLVLLFSKQTHSQTITIDNINSVASNFIERRSELNNSVLYKQLEYKIDKVHNLKSRETKEIFAYAVSLSPTGFIVLSSSSDIDPIIAYSFNHDWNTDTTKSNIFYQILSSDLSNRLQFIDTIPEERIDISNSSWNNYLIEEKSNESNIEFQQWPQPGTTTTGGWVETTLHQVAPYNNYCPIDPKTNQRSVVGCGPTAIAQIANFHKYFGNKRLTDSDKYSYGNPEINIDDDSTNLDFPSFRELNHSLDIIQNKYDNDLPLNDEDFAALSFAFGVFTQARYSSSSTGIDPFDVWDAFSIHLQYSSADIRSPINGFYEDLKDNMINGLPAEITLMITGGYHAIVCDGYNTDDFFHFNFGWGGNSPTSITDCWYKLPDGLPQEYNNIQNAVINIKPGVDQQSLIVATDSILIFESVLPNTSTDEKICGLRNYSTNNINIEKISAPPNFYISLDGVNYSNNLGPVTIMPVSEVPLYVYCKPDSIGKFEGEIELTILRGNLKRYLKIELIGFGAPDGYTIITQNIVTEDWDALNSPYLILDDISIEAGEKLTIEPGTHIEMFSNCNFEIGENTQLIATGTKADSIYFTAYDPERGCNGLSFIDSGDDDIFTFCVFTAMGSELIDGGALNSNLTNITIRDSRFYKNRGRNGGAIYETNSSLNISSSKFIANNAYFGGSLYLIGSNSKIEDTIFELNNAGSGGAIYMRDSAPLLNRLIFTNNSASVFGGAIYMRSSSPTCQYLEINKNTSADLGGAIYLIGSTPKISFANFFNNTALSSGGIFYSSNSEFSINNCIWDSNIAQNEGSLFSSSKSSISFNNITAVNYLGNLFTDLISINNSNTILIKNSIFWTKNNNANHTNVKTKFDQNSVSSVLTDTIKFYYNNMDSLLIQEISEWNSNIVVVGQNLNTSSDPQFTDYENKDFKLLDNSLCIDAGDPNDDIGNEPFPHGYCVNLGAYGATEDAAITADSSITAAPYPINFGEFLSVFSKEITIYLKNGTLYDIDIMSISVKDSTYFSLSDSPFVDNNILPSESIDSVTIQFTPPDMGEGIFDTELIIRTNSSEKIVPIFARLYEGTHIGGNISGILTRENGPYTVDEDLIITESLVIEPGVHLRFDEGCGINVEADGKLIAKGSKNDSIKFSSRNPTLGWRGIKIENSADDDTLDFCIIRYAIDGPGLWVIASNPFIKNCYFFRNQNFPCMLGDSPSSQDPIPQRIVISNCRFEQNSQAIYVIYSSAIIKNTVFNNSFGASIRFVGRYGVNNKLKLINVSASRNYSDRCIFDFSYYLNEDSVHVHIINSILDKNMYESGSLIWTYSANISIEHSNIDTTSDNWFYARKFLDRPVGKLFWGEGNISTDPLFVDSDNDDFTLLEDSPCIDTGNPNEIYNDIEDPFNSGFALWPAMGSIRNDMGAFGGGSHPYVTSVKDLKTDDELPVSYSLSQNYPNPFNPSTTIKYSIPSNVKREKSSNVIPSGVEEMTVEIKIYDILGREVATLVNKQQKPGNYEVSWNAANNSSGVYFYRLKVGSFTNTKKMLLLR